MQLYKLVFVKITKQPVSSVFFDEIQEGFGGIYRDAAESTINDVRVSDTN